MRRRKKEGKKKRSNSGKRCWALETELGTTGVGLRKKKDPCRCRMWCFFVRRGLRSKCGELKKKNRPEVCDSRGEMRVTVGDVGMLIFSFKSSRRCKVKSVTSRLVDVGRRRKRRFCGVGGGSEMRQMAGCSRGSAPFCWGRNGMRPGSGECCVRACW